MKKILLIVYLSISSLFSFANEGSETMENQNESNGFWEVCIGPTFITSDEVDNNMDVGFGCNTRMRFDTNNEKFSFTPFLGFKNFNSSIDVVPK